MNTIQFDDFDEQSQEELRGYNFISLEDLQRGIIGQDPFADIRTNKILLGETIRGMTNVHPLVTQKFFNRSTKDLSRLYFPDAEKQDFKTQGIYTNIDVDCESAKPLLKDSLRFFIDKNDNSIEDEGEPIFKVHIYTAKNPNKLKEAFECATPNNAEMLLFIEDNTGDYSKQWVRIKVSDDLREHIKNSSLYSTTVVNAINRNAALTQEQLKQLVEAGELQEELNIANGLLSGLGYFILAISAPFKGAGWVLEQLGLGIDFLKVPENIWDTQHDDYILKKDDITETLTINTSLIDQLETAFTNDKTTLEFNDLLPGFVNELIVKVLRKLKGYVNNYNAFIATSYNDSLDSALFEDFKRNVAFRIGVYNGIIDFIASTLQFFGSAAQAPFEVANDWQGFLETVDNILDSIENIDFSKLSAIFSAFFEQIEKDLKAKDKDEYDLVRIFYIIGFAVAFIGTMFIPVAGWAGKLAKLAKLDKLIPQKLLEALQKAANGIKVAGKNAKQSVLLTIEKLFALFAKGGDELKQFLDSLRKTIVDWFLKNKKRYQLVEKVDVSLLRSVRILRKNKSYKDAIDYIKLIGRPLGRWLALESEAAVNLYTTGYYILLNKALRKLDDVKLTTEFKALQKILDDALNKLPNFKQDGFLMRSAYFSEADIKKLFKAGKDFTDKGFMSTTYSESALFRWMKQNPRDNVLFKVYGKNGKLIEVSSASKHEAEILFKSGTKFLVESVREIPKPTNKLELITEIILKEK